MLLQQTINTKKVSLVGTSGVTLTFNDTGSGHTSDGRCFVLNAISSNMTSSLSFSSMNIQFLTNTTLARRRRAGSLLFYTPVAPNSVVVRYQSTTSASYVDSGSTSLALEDKISPQWIACPSNINVVASAGQVSATASWSEPTAIDNVGVTKTTTTAAPGAVFMIVNSPNAVVYSAWDANNNVGTCTFYVTVTFTPVPAIIDQSTPRDFPSSYIVSNALHISTYTHYIIGSNQSIFSNFTADLGARNQLTLRMRSAVGDRVLMRTRKDAMFGQLSLNLRWVVSGVSNPTVALLKDATATYAFEGFAQDTSADGLSIAAAGGSELASTGSLVNPSVYLDSSQLIQVTTQSASFRRGFSFTGLSVTLR
jgi:hypothetical protein